MNIQDILKTFDEKFELEQPSCSECSGTELIDKTEVRYPKGSYHNEWDLDKIKSFLRTAIQQAFEATNEGPQIDAMNDYEKGYNSALSEVKAKQELFLKG